MFETVNVVGARCLPEPWEVLVHQPLGSFVRIPNDDGLPLSFEHAALQVTVRSPLERTFLSRIARTLGYVKDDEQGNDSIFIRRDHPRPNARLQLTDLLRDTQERQRVRGAPPRWWNYVDVIAPPAEVPHFRWQLQIDHTDDQRPEKEKITTVGSIAERTVLATSSAERHRQTNHEDG